MSDSDKIGKRVPVRQRRNIDVASRAAVSEGSPPRAADIHRPRLVLFVGIGGVASASASGAALWFGTLAAQGKATAVLASIGGPPAESPPLVAAMAERGFETRRLIARALTPELIAAADLIVTISAGRRAAIKLLKTARRKEHWTIANVLDGPRRVARATAKDQRTANGDSMAAARMLRDDLRARVAMLVFSEGWGRREISREDARVTRPPMITPARESDPFIPGRSIPPMPWIARPSFSASQLR